MSKILANNTYKICPRGFPHQGEIYKVYFSKKGKEIGKIRPALVISNNAQNEFDDQIMVAPLSSEEIEISRSFEVLIKNTLEIGLDYPSKILVGYSFAIYKELRLIERLGVVSKEIMIQVKLALKITFDLED